MKQEKTVSPNKNSLKQKSSSAKFGRLVFVAKKEEEETAFAARTSNSIRQFLKTVVVGFKFLRFVMFRIEVFGLKIPGLNCNRS
jgi:hypothetical protein